MSRPVSILSTKMLSAKAVGEAERLGITLTQIGFIRTEKTDTACWVRQAILPADVFAFTSARAVQAVTESGIRLSQAPLAALCGSTRQALADARLTVSFTANHAKALAQEIIRSHPKRVTFFCGDNHRTELPDALTQHGISVNRVIVYKTMLTPTTVTEKYDGILFFSPSAVQSFLMNNVLPAYTTLFCIGDTTAGAIPDTTSTIIISPVPSPIEMLRLAAHHFSEHVKK